MIEHEVLSSSSSSSGSATFLNPRLVNQEASLSFAFSGMVHAKMVLKYLPNLIEKILGLCDVFLPQYELQTETLSYRKVRNRRCLSRRR